VTEGVVLYDAGRVAIAVPELTSAMHHWLARDAVERFFEHTAQLYLGFERNLAHGSLAISVSSSSRSPLPGRETRSRISS
jgi:hypothetical protein